MSRSRKLDINRATREDLMQVAGLRPAAADALLRHREKVGKITNVEALNEVNGIGESTLERLRSHTEVASEAAPEARKKSVEVSSKALGSVGQPANDAAPAAAKAGEGTLTAAATSTEAAAELTERATRTLVQRVEEAAETADHLIGQAQDTTTGSLGGELGSLWLATLNAQVEDGVSTLKGLVAARNVNDMVELQARFVSQSVGRMADFQSRSLAAIGKATSGPTER